MTEAKRGLINASRSSVELFINHKMNQFKKGYVCSTAFEKYVNYCKNKNTYSMSERMFVINVKQYCSRKQIQVNIKISMSILLE